MVNITFKTLKQEIYNLDVDIMITIANLKQQLNQFGLQTECIKLIFKGKILEDANTLETYKYNPESKDFIVIMTQKIQPLNQSSNQSSNDQPSNDQPSNQSSTDQQSNNQQSNQSSNQSSNNENDDDYEDMDENPHGIENIAHLLQQHPEILLSLMAQYPQMSQMLNQYPNEIQELISNPEFMQSVVSMGNQGVFNNNQNILQINITEEERNDINELMTLGFTENEVIQVYFACNKNKEQTASMLFEDIN
jgi:hypothetical protein